MKSKLQVTKHVLGVYFRCHTLTIVKLVTKEKYLMFENKTFLITGGTGSFGKALATTLLIKHPEVAKVIIFSRDELKQYEMQESEPFRENEKVRFFIGDVRDLDRLMEAFENVDFIVHAAALKQVPAAEYNPLECIKTNILGTQNVITAAKAQNVEALVSLSTDKASSPANLYGATKLCADKLVVASNFNKGTKDYKAAVVRYGNVINSRGSVIPKFEKLASTGLLPVTDPSMTRFSISLEQGVDLVIWASQNLIGGEIFVPRLPSYRITDLARAICQDCEIEIVGIRPGEKNHEEMISNSDARNTIELSDKYVIVPEHNKRLYGKHLAKYGANFVDSQFVYSSGDNDSFLTVSELRNQLESWTQRG